MAGLVSISASCINISFTNSLVVGAVGATLFMISKRILYRLEIDDPLNVTSIHLVCGVWGLLAEGIFDKNTGLVYSNNPAQITT